MFWMGCSQDPGLVIIRPGRAQAVGGHELQLLFSFVRVCLSSRGVQLCLRLHVWSQHCAVIQGLPARQGQPGRAATDQPFASRRKGLEGGSGRRLAPRNALFGRSKFNLGRCCPPWPLVGSPSSGCVAQPVFAMGAWKRISMPPRALDATSMALRALGERDGGSPPCSSVLTQWCVDL